MCAAMDEQHKFWLPHNIESEQAILGSLLLDNRVCERVDWLKADHFYDPMHAQIFHLIAITVEAGRLASPVTLKTAVGAWPPISDDLSVAQYLGRLAVAAGNPRDAIQYANVVKKLAIRRSIIDIGNALVAGGVNENEDETKTMNAAEIALFALAEKGTASREVTFKDAIESAVEAANEAHQRGGKMAGISTGFIDLDEKLGGLQKSDIIVLAGRPAIGKTALCTNIAFSVAKNAIDANGEVNGHVHFFSQEMSAAQLAMRLLGEHADIASDKLRRGTFDQSEFRTVMSTAERIKHMPITIDETGGITLTHLVTKARRVKRVHNTSLIVIDYLQLMSGSNRSGENRVQEITTITKGLKALAKELDVPIIALSQLSRKVEERTDKRPQLADLRESGSIEQDADIVMFVYRDDYYLDREEPSQDDFEAYVDWKTRKDAASGKAEVIIAKSRHSSTGIVHLSFEAERTRFGNLARQDNRYGQ